MAVHIDLPALSARELQVLNEIIKGAAYKEAAYHLGISPRTIEQHVAHLRAKVGARNVADLVRIAMLNGLRPRG